MTLSIVPAPKLLLYSENCVLRRLGDSEFDYGLGWNLDLLLRFGIEARARFPLLLHQLAEAGQDKFAVLFGRFVSESAERIEEYSSGLLIGLALLQQERVEVLFWSCLAVAYGSGMAPFQEIRFIRRAKKGLCPSTRIKRIAQLPPCGPPPTSTCLLSKCPNAPFGLSWYQGDIETNKDGVGLRRVHRPIQHRNLYRGS